MTYKTLHNLAFCYLSKFVFYNHFQCCTAFATLVSLSIFLKHFRHFLDLGHWHWFFPLPKIFFTQIATWLHPSCVSSFCLNITFSMRSHFNIQLRITTPTQFRVLQSMVSGFIHFCFDRELDFFLNGLVHSCFSTMPWR